MPGLDVTTRLGETVDTDKAARRHRLRLGDRGTTITTLDRVSFSGPTSFFRLWRNSSLIAVCQYTSSSIDRGTDTFSQAFPGTVRLVFIPHVDWISGQSSAISVS